MSMSLAAAKAFIQAKMTELFGAAEDSEKADKAAELIASIVVYIKSDAVVNTTGNATTQSGTVS